MARKIQVYDEDFTRYSNTGQTGRRVLVGQVTVQRGRVWLADPGLPWGIRMATRVSIPLTASAGRTTYVATLGFPFPDPAWLDQADKVRAVFVEGTTVTAQGIVTYDAAAGSVTANVTANAGTLQIDVLMPQGTIQVAKAAPLGHSGTRERVIYQADLRRLHLVDQQKAPVRVEGRHPMLQDWSFNWYLTSDRELVWDSPLTVVMMELMDESLTVWEQALREVPPEQGGPYSLDTWAALETANW